MTRWVEAASVARIIAADVSKFVLDYICSRFGTPLEILSDRGPCFRTDLLDALLENLSIKHVHSTPYYPQCNGLVEKTNGVLCKIITKHVRDRPQDWDKHLIAALWAYRTSFKVSTQFTPYHLVYGQKALLPIEVELGSLRVFAKDVTSLKEKLEQRILDLQQLELDREAATDYYIAQANKKREQFNNKVKDKKLKEGMLVMSSLLDERDFHKFADELLHHLQERFDELGEECDLDGFDVDYAEGVLTIKLGRSGTYVINKQTPNRQIWLSSPISGPARFDWDMKDHRWVYRRTKVEIFGLLEKEVQELVGASVALSK
ncbi:hypothetical protein L7F22_040754 [Adiantum nelumboides]|nr:hypothetical protein [Adiantum nelumboides]